MHFKRFHSLKLNLTLTKYFILTWDGSYTTYLKQTQIKITIMNKVQAIRLGILTRCIASYCQFFWSSFRQRAFHSESRSHAWSKLARLTRFDRAPSYCLCPWAIWLWIAARYAHTYCPKPRHTRARTRADYFRWESNSWRFLRPCPKSRCLCQTCNLWRK